MSESRLGAPPLAHLIDQAPVGLVVLNRDFEVVFWNGFMALHSGRGPEEIVGHNLFDCFPELPRPFLEKKIESVFLLQHQSFTSWEQRPYLFPFPHNRPITGGVDHMRQSCTFIPVPDESGAVTHVGLTVFDMTDASIYQEQLAEAKAQVEELSTRDALTGAFNRGYMDQSLEGEINRVERHGGALAAILLDVDHFKQVNDRYGHKVGDQVLQGITRLIHDELRTSDYLGRFGGEEFLIVLPETDVAGARRLAERVRRRVAAEAFPAVGQVTVSLGVAERVAKEDPDDLLRRADQTLYAAKAAGRNRVEVAGGSGESGRR